MPRAATTTKTKTRTPPKAPAKNAADTAQALRYTDHSAQIAAVNQVMSVAEFSLDGTLLRINENLLKALGFTESEVLGQNHAMFVSPAFRQSPEYRSFWERLNRGESISGQFKRTGKGGAGTWVQASYIPIKGPDGKVMKVVDYAIDVTEQVTKSFDFSGQIDAINKAQAVIEFSLDGKVLRANANFLNALGYAENEIVGQHHSMFVDPVYRQSQDYRLFWEKLGRGEYDAGQ
jgi:methyl-accepting chemotaxis protein